jgi:membrane-associated phospholipid phosphatase
MALSAYHALPNVLNVRIPSIPRPGRRAISLSLGIAFLLLMIDAAVHARAFFDLWAIQVIQRLEAPGLHGYFEAIEKLTGSEGAIATWAVAFVLFLALRWWAAAIVLGLMPIGGALNEAVGTLIVERSRPHLAELARTSSNWEERSFPSGHVMGAVMFYGMFFVIARRIANRTLRLGIQVSSVVVIATMGIERVWEGAHWPTDVLGAYTLGGLLLVALIAIYRRLDAAVDGLPLIRAAALPHDETTPHAHALTSLVLFDGERVAKVYAPGLLPRALYWLAFQAPFPYIRNRAALDAAMHRRNLAAQLTEYWYGSSRVARIIEVERTSGQYAVISERIDGTAPASPYVAKSFLAGLRARFEEAGLPTWQIDPRQPRAIDNVIETADGSFQIVDLESGLVSPVASFATWWRAVRRGKVPFFDDVFFDVTRAYVAREEAAMRAARGEDWLNELDATLAAAEAAATEWHRSEPRVWNRLLTGIVTGFGVRTWRGGLRVRFAGSREKAQAWMDRAVTTWEREERITAEEAATLRAQMAEPTFQAMLPYLGAHVIVSIPLRFPLGSIVRPVMVVGALGVASGRLLLRRIDRAEWGRAWSILSPLVMMLAGVPGFGSFAYLAAKPVRANRLLLRTLTDAAAKKAPWNLYERSGLRRLIARPTALERAATDTGSEKPPVSEVAGDAGPIWELAWAARPRTARKTRSRPVAAIAELPVPSSTTNTKPAPRVA